MTFYYTARSTYDKQSDEDGMSWEKYLEWSKLTHLKELVSVDGMLNENLVQIDRNNDDDWNHIVIDNYYETGFYTTLEFVLSKMEPKERFNLLTVVVEPTNDCENIEVEDFEFVGYDLLDKEYNISALTNCGGFDESFLPSDLNCYGLIDKYEKSSNIKQQLLENNPEEHHADTNVIAIWRHKILGRKKAEPLTLVWQKTG